MRVNTIQSYIATIHTSMYMMIYICDAVVDMHHCHMHPLLTQCLLLLPMPNSNTAKKH
jgi:hypothetical protein